MSSLIPFTFNLPVPGLPNPFLLQQQRQRQQQLQQQQQQREKKPRLPRRPPPLDPSTPSVLKKRRRSVSPMPIVAPSPRSRGWTPTMAEPSCSATTITTTGGYLDRASRYGEMRETEWVDAQYNREVQDIIEGEFFVRPEPLNWGGTMGPAMCWARACIVAVPFPAPSREALQHLRLLLSCRFVGFAACSRPFATSPVV
jgi:hypothetical protein